MDLGVFSEPGKNWVLIWSAIGCVILFAAAIAYIVVAYANWEERAGLFSKSKAGEVCNEAIFAGILAACLFIAIWPLLGIGLYADHERECLEPQFASEGVYELGPHTTFITYYTEGVGSSAVARKPKDIEMYLLGRADKKHTDNQKVERCIKIPFDKSTKAYNFDTFRGSQGNHFPVTASGETIIKGSDGWWHFPAASAGGGDAQ